VPVARGTYFPASKTRREGAGIEYSFTVPVHPAMLEAVVPVGVNPAARRSASGRYSSTPPVSRIAFS
jgi:hypothetical protein